MTDTESQQPKVILHWLDKSRSQRVVWLLESCKGLSYEIKVYKRLPNKLAPASLKEIHPLGKSPAVTVDVPGTTTQPLVLAESGAIFDYLSDCFAQHLIPKRYKAGQEGKVGGETEEWLRCRFYMHYAEGSLMMMLFVSFLLDQIRNAPVPFFIKPITRGIAAKIDDSFLTQNLNMQFSFLESQLDSSPNGGEYLCGAELTAADIIMSYPIIAAKGKFSNGTYPKLTAYAERLEKHEGYVASVKKVEALTGEKYEILP